MKLAYLMTLEEAEGEWIARIPQFPEVLTSGHSPADAQLQASDALGLVVRLRLRDGDVVPLPDRTLRGALYADLDLSTSKRVIAAADRL